MPASSKLIYAAAPAVHSEVPTLHHGPNCRQECHVCTSAPAFSSCSGLRCGLLRATAPPCKTVTFISKPGSHLTRSGMQKVKIIPLNTDFPWSAHHVLQGQKRRGKTDWKALMGVENQPQT